MVPSPMAIKPISVVTRIKAAIAAYSRSMDSPQGVNFEFLPAGKYNIRTLKSRASVFNFTMLNVIRT
jgi:hypothetical protein